MDILYVSLKQIYFEKILVGEKFLEFRLATSHWKKRLENQAYDSIILALGYPSASDISKRLYRQWSGGEVQTIEHSHFRKDPVEVFAIDVTTPWLNAGSAS